MNAPPPKPRWQGLSPLTLVLINQLALPGLGSVLAGRRVGYFQIAISLVGFAATLYYMVALLQGILAAIDLGQSWSWAAFANDHPQETRLGAWGGALCLAGWFWTLWTSIQLLHASERTPPPPARPPSQ